MPKEIIITIVLAVIQIPIGTLGATMPDSRSKVPSLSSGMAIVVIMALLAFYWGNKLNANQVIYGSIGITLLSVTIASIFIFRYKFEAKKETSQNNTLVLKSASKNKIAWQVYDNLAEKFRALMSSSDKAERDKIYTQIEVERGKLPDKNLDELIKLFLDAESESNEFGLDKLDDISQSMLRIMNERMRNHIDKKYGRRINE